MNKTKKQKFAKRQNSLAGTTVYLPMSLIRKVDMLKGEKSRGQFITQKLSEILSNQKVEVT